MVDILTVKYITDAGLPCIHILHIFIRISVDKMWCDLLRHHRDRDFSEHSVWLIIQGKNGDLFITENTLISFSATLGKTTSYLTNYTSFGSPLIGNLLNKILASVPRHDTVDHALLPSLSVIVLLWLCAVVDQGSESPQWIQM